MSRISCAVPQADARKFFGFLQADGRVQLILLPAPADADPLTDRLLVLRERLCAVMETLQKIPAPPDVHRPDAERQLDEDVENILDESFASVVPELEKSVGKFEEDLSAALKDREELLEEQKVLELILGSLRSLAFEDSPGRERIIWRVPEEFWPLALRQIEKQHADEPVQFHDRAASGEDQVLAELSVPVHAVASVEEILRSVGAHPWTPPLRYRAESYAESVELMERRLAEIESLLVSREAALIQMRKQWEPRQENFFLLTDRKVGQYEALSRCERVGGAVLVRGWIPERELDDFKARAEEKFSGRVALYAREPEEDEREQAPTALRHGKFFAPFEIFLKLVQPPAYGSADPTALIGVFFPFFSGCITGDAGYGLVMLILMLLLRRKSKNKLVRDVAFVLINVCLWSFFWGAAFGEFFGDTAHRLFHIHPLWVERSEAVMPVLLFSVALGLGHVLIGMAVGLVHGLRARHKKHAMEKLGAITVILAMVAALLSVRQLLPPQALPAGIAALLIGLVLLAAGGGIGGLIESMSSFGHILSYVRIGAIGLSSAILAVAASKFVDVLGVSALGIFIALAIHLLNFVLAFAESGLHAARLHYVEFMGNFYEAKGTEYRPFAYRRNLPWKKDS